MTPSALVTEGLDLAGTEPASSGRASAVVKEWAAPPRLFLLFPAARHLVVDADETQYQPAAWNSAVACQRCHRSELPRS